MTICKKMIQARMEETGENYAAARKAILVEKARGGDARALGDLASTDPALHQLIVTRHDWRPRTFCGAPAWFGPDPVPSGYVRWPS